MNINTTNRRGFSHPITIRVHGLPRHEGKAEKIAREAIQEMRKLQSKYKLAIVPACERADESVALVTFPPGSFASSEDAPNGALFVGDRQINLDSRFFGLTQVSKENVPVLFDVYAICGIGGHGWVAWQSKEAPFLMLLHDLLPGDFPACRFLSCAYDANLASRDHATLDDYAQNLLDSIERVRQGKAEDRPAVFIAHSFGGVVLTQALLLASSNAGANSTMGRLLNSLYGIMFFAVPHGGMDIQDMREIVGESDHPRQVLVDTISRGSEQVKARKEKFQRFIYEIQEQSPHCKVVSFFETRQSSRYKKGENGLWTRSGELSLLLRKDDAILDLRNSLEICIAIPRKDHYNIIKFDSRYDDGYAAVRQHLRKLLVPVINRDKVYRDVLYRNTLVRRQDVFNMVLCMIAVLLIGYSAIYFFAKDHKTSSL